MSTDVRPDAARFVASLLSRAEADCRRAREEAGRSAEKILTNAREQARVEREKRLAWVRQRTEREAERRLSEARHRHEMDRLRVMEQAHERVVAEACAELESLRGRPEYEGLLDRLLEECLRECPEPVPTKIWIDGRDRQPLQGILERRGWDAVEVEEAGPLLGGLKVGDVAGDWIIDNTLDARLAARSSEIRRRMASLLLSKESSWPSATRT